MAVIPQEAIKDWHAVKPSSYAAFCLLCEVKDSRCPDVYLDASKAAEFHIGKSAYYYAFKELEEKGWIAFAGTIGGKKRWRLVKGFSANVETAPIINSTNVENEPEIDSINAENSANVEKITPEIPQTWKPFSANVENPLQSPIRINPPKEETKPKKNLSETSSDVGEKVRVPKIKVEPKPTPEQTTFRHRLWEIQNAYAPVTAKGLIIANNLAIKKLFSLARGDTSICDAIRTDLLTEAWRKGRVTWIEVEKDFNFYKARIEGERNGAIKQNERKQPNGSPKPTNAGDRATERIANTNAVIVELLRLGEQKSGVSG